MANTDAPSGFKPVMHRDGSPWNGQVRRCVFLAADTTATFVGDAVKSSGTADADGIPSVAQLGTNTAARGVVVAFEPDPTNLGLNYRTASTLRYAYICEDPTVLYEVQEDDATATNIAITAVGNNTDIVVGTGSTTTGVSGMEIDADGVGTSTAQCRIVQLVQKPDNAIGASAKWLVYFNEHENSSTTGT